MVQRLMQSMSRAIESTQVKCNMGTCKLNHSNLPSIFFPDIAGLMNKMIIPSVSESINWQIA